jgi:hypothetical protein
MSQDKTAEQNKNIRNDNSAFERLEEFGHLGTTLTDQLLFRKKLRAD